MKENENERTPLTVNQVVSKINETVETLTSPVTTPLLIKTLSEDESMSVLDKMEIALFIGHQLYEQKQVASNIMIQ